MTAVVLAVLAAVGLGAIFWLVYGAFLIPVGTMGTVRIYLLASGTGEEVEQTLKGLWWLRSSCLLAGKVDIVDAGLNGEGRARVKQLLKRYSGVHLIQTEKNRE
jgi:hypothetical protein